MEYTTTQGQVFLNAQQSQDPNQSFIGVDEPTSSDINEVITRKRGQASVSLQYPRSTVTLTGYQEDRNYQYSGSQDVLGLTAFWNWRFAKRTTSQLMVLWQSMDNKPISESPYNTDLSLISLGVHHAFTRYVSGGLTYRYTDQGSNLPTAEYTENRVMANMYFRF